jgi:hypothetical protein
VHNAFNAQVIAELTRTFAALDADDGDPRRRDRRRRQELLRRRGPQLDEGDGRYSRAQNLADAQALAVMLRTLNGMTKPTDRARPRRGDGRRRRAWSRAATSPSPRRRRRSRCPRRSLGLLPARYRRT